MQTKNPNLQYSGLYKTPFFTTVNMPCDEINYDNIEWDRDLHKQYSIDEDDFAELSEDDFDDLVYEDFYNAAFTYNYYQKVEKYNHEDAYKCRLIPFTYYSSEEGENVHLLALGGCGMDLSPKLDAYFFLQTGKLDPASMYFSDKDYFKSLVSTEIFNTIEDKFGGVTV